MQTLSAIAHGQNDDLIQREPRTAIIIGAGYVGLEMAEGLRGRGIHVTQLQRGPEVLSTLDPELSSIVHAELVAHGIDVHTGTTVRAVEKTAGGLAIHAEQEGRAAIHTADLVLVVVGVRPNTALLEQADQLNPDSEGGCVLLGVDGICVIAHGSSNARAIRNSVRRARECVETEVVQRMKGALADAG